MAKIVAHKEVSVTSAFKEDEVPPAGVLTDHQEELTKVKSALFTAAA